jgi:alpha-tubulin suppressor-like RCC1 family protein
LGHGDYANKLVPMHVGKEAFGGSEAVMVASCDRHSLVVTEDGELWTCGRVYALGPGDSQDKLVPTRVGVLRFGGAKIDMAAAGVFHAISATTEGDVWTFGFGGGEGLGLNDEESRYVLTQIDSTLFGASPVVMVAAGESHSVAVTAEGALFAWDKGAYGKLGLCNTDNRLTPTHVGGRMRLAGRGCAWLPAVPISP